MDGLRFSLRICKNARGVALAYALDGTDGIACIDLDRCIGEDGKRSALADEVLSKCGKTYIESSVSGKGLHIFGTTKGEDLRSFSKDGDMEYYQGGQFIAMTGDGAGYSRLASFDTPEMKSLLSRKLERRQEWKNTGKGVAGAFADGRSRASRKGVLRKERRYGETAV